MLNWLLAHHGLTLNDSLTIATHVTNGSNDLCYNFVLGKFVHTACTHHHVDAGEITDAFATELVNKLHPAILDIQLMVSHRVSNGAAPDRRCCRGMATIIVLTIN